MTTTIPVLTELDLPSLDATSEEFKRDPRAVLGRIARQSPLLRSARGTEVLRLEWIRDIQADERFVTGGYLAQPVDAAPEPPYSAAFHHHGLLVAMSGEKHRRIRRVQSKAFALRRVDSLRGLVTEAADALVDGFIDRGEADIVWDFTHFFSITILCRTIGIPVEDIPLFDRATLAVAHRVDAPEEAEEGLRTLYDYVSKLVESRRNAPTDDLVSGMIAAQATDGKLSEDELIWNIVNLMFAGHDTTRYQLALLVKTLVDLGQWDLLAQRPDLIPAAVVEGIRWDPTVPYPPARQASEDIELRGLLVPAGTWLTLNMYAAARDETVFPDPDRFDLTRTGLMYDTFGHGVHYCLGFGLATAELEEGLKVLTARLADVTFTACEAEVYPSPVAMLGPRSLKATFRARR